MKTRSILAILSVLQILSLRASTQHIITDHATVRTLKRTLVAGGEIYYPAEAAKANLGGRGKYGMHVGAGGKVEKVTVVKSSGVELLDCYMQERLMTYRFRPGVWSPVVFEVEFIPPKDNRRARALTGGYY